MEAGRSDVTVVGPTETDCRKMINNNYLTAARCVERRHGLFENNVFAIRKPQLQPVRGTILI